MSRMKLKKCIHLKKSDVFLSIIVIILLMTYIFLRIFSYKSHTILLNYAKRKSINIISTIINKSLDEVLYNENYEEIIELKNDYEADISDININNKQINQMLYSMTENILNSISMLEDGNYDDINTNYTNNEDLIYYVPIGVILNIPVLVNLGPKIPFKIDILGSVNNEVLTEIKDYGINNSLIEVKLKTYLQVQVILPFMSETFDVEKNIIIDSKIIGGKIPDYYGNFNEITKN